MSWPTNYRNQEMSAIIATDLDALPPPQPIPDDLAEGRRTSDEQRTYLSLATSTCMAAGIFMALVSTRQRIGMMLFAANPFTRRSHSRPPHVPRKATLHFALAFYRDELNSWCQQEFVWAAFRSIYSACVCSVRFVVLQQIDVT